MLSIFARNDAHNREPFRPRSLAWRTNHALTHQISPRPPAAESKQEKNSHGRTQEQSSIHKIRIAPAPHPPRTRRPASSPAHQRSGLPRISTAAPREARHAPESARRGERQVRRAREIRILREHPARKSPERKGARSGGRTHVLPHQAWTVSAPMFPFRGYCRLRTSGVGRRCRCHCAYQKNTRMIPIASPPSSAADSTSANATPRAVAVRLPRRTTQTSGATHSCTLSTS